VICKISECDQQMQYVFILDAAVGSVKYLFISFYGGHDMSYTRVLCHECGGASFLTTGSDVYVSYRYLRTQHVQEKCVMYWNWRRESVRIVCTFIPSNCLPSLESR
jgi:hypothetical protein